jgi:hypothetical protein
MWNQADILKDYSKIEKGNISIKQKEYINSLINSVKDINLTDICKKLNIDKLTDDSLNTLNTTQIFILIEELKRLAPMNIMQSLLIMDQFDNTDVKKIIKKEMQDLSIKDAETLLAGPEKFIPWIKEHPIVSQDEWEYGWQESDKFTDGKMYYLKLYNMMMIDIDTHENFDQVLSQLKLINMKFRIYQTYGGYHIFIISDLIKYNHPELIKLTKALGGDIYYALFANKTGFKVRLNSKIDRKEPYIARYVCEVGIKPINFTCKELIKIHDHYIKLHL